MAADILMFDVDNVPVGQDQISHIEAANDIGEKFNYIYNCDVFKYINTIVNKENVLPGKDGRKMSKSYGNTLPLFCSEDELKKYVFSMKTNSKGEGEPKESGDSVLCDLYRSFVSEDLYKTFLIYMEKGTSWKDLKQIVYDDINDELEPYKELYNKNKDKFDHVSRFLDYEMTVNFLAIDRMIKIKQVIGVN